MAGVREYVSFATGLMEKKCIPEDLIEHTRELYRSDEGIERQRARAEEMARRCLDLAPHQLLGMVVSPLTDHGARQSLYLRIRDNVPRLAHVSERSTESAPVASELGLENWAANLLGRRRSLSIDGDVFGTDCVLEKLRLLDPHSYRIEDKVAVAGTYISGR
jgi:hypothetical protein